MAGEQFGLPGVWAAVALTVMLAALFGWLLARYPLARTWPALLLAAYVVWPEVNTALALSVAAVCGFTWAFLTLDWTANATPSVQVRPGLIALGVFAIALAAYGYSLSPDVLPADSGELQVVAAELGVAHPPGFPLYTLLAHAITKLPVGPSPAYRVNLFSAVTGALALAVVYLAVQRLTRRTLSGLLAALALGGATTYWAQATTANVRSLTALFTALVFYCLIRWREDVRAQRGDRWLVAAALSMGFGLTHHPSLIFLLVVVLIFVVVADRSLLKQPRRWLWPVVAGLAGLLPLLYLPLRANAVVRGASPALATLPGFLEHVLATGFRGDLFYYTDATTLWERLRIMGEVFTFSFAPLLLAGMLVGLALLLWRDRPLAWLLGGSAAVFTLVAATYRAPQTVEYMMPAYVALAIVLGYAVGVLPYALARGPAPVRAGSAAFFAALMLVAGLRQLVDHAPPPDLSARDYARELLDGAPPDGTILAHWHWVTPLWYLQEVEGLRPDVVIRFVYPDGESYDANWDERTREAFASGGPVITTYVPPAPREGLPVPEPLGEALLYPAAPRTALPENFTATALQLGGAVEVLGYRVEGLVDGALPLDGEAVVTVAWRPRDDLPPGASLFLHAIGPDGLLYGQSDQPALAGDGITLTQFRVALRPGTPLEQLDLVLGANAGGQVDHTSLTHLDVIPRQTAPFTGNPVQRTALDGSGRILVGYDWDHTAQGRRRLYLHWQESGGGYTTQVVDDAAADVLTLPAFRGPWGVPATGLKLPVGAEDGRYVPFGGGLVWTGDAIEASEYAIGETVPVDVVLHSDRAIRRDTVVSVRLMGLQPDGVSWAWWDLEDSVPAMGAIPTLKWIDGSSVRSPARPVVQTAAEAGQALTGALTLYDAFTNRPLPILDERLTAVAPWVPLGSAIVSGE